MFLKQLAVESILPSKPKRAGLEELIQINDKTSLEECLNLLVQKNILAVPVYDSEEKKFVGILDMYEIMSFIAFASWDANTQDVNLQEFVSKTEMEQPAKNLLGTSGVEASDSINSLWIQPATAGIKDTIELMGKGVYRILVDFGADKFKILTQSDLARFFLTQWDNFTFKDTLISEAFKEKAVHKISTTHSALRGFQSIRLHEVNALAVVDDGGKLVGTLSGSDLRGLSHDKVTNVMLPVMEFLKGQGQGGHKPVTCKNTETLKSVVERLVAEKVHRIWIVDNSDHPTGVISLSDIALFVFTQTLAVWYPAEPEDGTN